MNDMPPIEEITRRIVEHFAPRRIVLFGSRARGAAQPDSDLDIFVEMESEASPPDRRIAVSSLFFPRTWPLDVIVYTPAEVERLRGKIGTLFESIETEGRILYEQG